MTKSRKKGLTFLAVYGILTKLSGTRDTKPKRRASRKNLKKCVDKVKNFVVK